jgi:hypothetical protein
MEGEEKAKGLIAQKGKDGCTEEKMREDEAGGVWCVPERKIEPV